MALQRDIPTCLSSDSYGVVQLLGFSNCCISMGNSKKMSREWLASPVIIGDETLVSKNKEEKKMLELVNMMRSTLSP